MLGSPCTDSKPHHSPQDEEAELLLLPHHQRQRPRVTLVPVPLGRLASLRKNRKVDASSPFRASPGLCGILGPLRAKGGMWCSPGTDISKHPPPSGLLLPRPQQKGPLPPLPPFGLVASRSNGKADAADTTRVSLVVGGILGPLLAKGCIGCSPRNYNDSPSLPPMPMPCWLRLRLSEQRAANG